MVPCLRGVVEDGTFRLPYYILYVHVRILGSFNKFIKILDICFFMTPVMIIDRFLRDSRCESVGCVREFGLGEYFSLHNYVRFVCWTLSYHIVISHKHRTRM